MAIIYMDPEGGNDANDGLSFANRVKTITSGLTAARIAPGDHVRVIGSPPKTDTGVDATWTNLSPTVTLGSALNALITDCESAWTAAANVTATAVTVRRNGSNAASLAIAAGFTTGKVAHFDLGSNQDYSAYQGITYWIRFSAASIAAGTLQIKLCSDANGDTPVDTFDIPANETMVTGYFPVYTDKGSALGSAIRSIAVYAVSDPGTLTIWLDNISTVKAKGSSQTDNLNLTSLISPGPDGLWWAIRAISGTTVTLEWYPGNENGTNTNGWAGTTGSYDLYKWETVLVRQVVGAFGQNDTLQDSGVLGMPITMSGGWNRSDMSAQDSETWLDGKWGWTDGIYNGTIRNYWTFEKINLVRWLKGYRLLFGTGVNVGNGGIVRASACQQSSFDFSSHTDGVLGNVQDTGGAVCTVSFPGCIRFTCGDVTHIGGGTASSDGIISAGTNEPAMTKIGNVDIRTCKNYAFNLGQTNIYRMKIGNVTLKNLGGGGFFNGFGGSTVRWFDVEIGDVDCDTFATGVVGFLFTPAHMGYRLRTGTLTIRNGAGTSWGLQGYPMAESMIKGLVTSGNAGAGWGNNNAFNFGAGRVRIKSTNLTDSTPRNNDSGMLSDLRCNGWIAFKNYLGVADAHRVEYSGLSTGSGIALVTSETGANRHTLSGLGWKLAVLNATVPTSVAPVRHILGKVYVEGSKGITFRLWVNRSNTALNCRLVVPGRDLLGVTSSVVDTAVASSGVWEELEVQFNSGESGFVYPELQAWGGSTHHVFFDDFTIVSGALFVSPFTDNFTNSGGGTVDIASWQSTEQASGNIDWAYVTSSPTDGLRVDNTTDRLIANAAQSGGLQRWDAKVLYPIGANDYHVEATVLSFLGTSGPWLSARMQSGALSGYIIQMADNSGIPTLRRYDAGVLTTLDTWPVSGVFGPCTAYIDVKGNSIKWFVDDGIATPARTVVDSNYPTGVPGLGLIYWPAVIGIPDANTVYIDNYTVTASEQ